jgi:D-glycero-D-manno-heptose 1,7-bisphosphate phosphatase
VTGIIMDRRHRPALFLDRDGVIIREKDFQIDINEIELYPDTLEALSALDGRYLKLVISNQSGVARGRFSEDDVRKFNSVLENMLEDSGIKMDGWYFCPHGPDDNCPCRKPRPGMILRAAEDLSIALADSWLVGDKSSDIMAGQAAGLKTILVKTGYAGREPGGSNVIPRYLAGNLLEAVEIINGSLN